MLTTAMKALLILLTALLSACGGAPSVTPTTPTPVTTQPTVPPPAPVAVTLTGTVSAYGGGRLNGAIVTILDGPNAGRSATTNSAGEYTLPDLQPSDANLAARAATYEEVRMGLFIDGTRRANFTLRTLIPWERSGIGDTVFDIPTYITRVRVIGTYTRTSSNFIMHVNGRLLVNELLGTAWGATRYEGILRLPNGAGAVEVVSSSGVAWSIAEVR